VPGRDTMKAAPLLALLLLATALPLPGQAATVRIVPDQYATIQEAVDAASAGDTVLVRAGTYNEAVRIVPGKEGLVVQGEGMGRTILDGNGEHSRGIRVTADDVTVRDLTLQHYQYSGTYFEEVDGFLMERLEAIDNGEYGLFAKRSQHGTVVDSKATGHKDGGLYIGESLYCFCIVERNEAWGNVMGFSGTAANFVTLRDNHFHGNRAGILLSTLPSEPGIQQHSTIVGNRIHDNNVAVPANPEAGAFYIPVGMGVAIAGGSANAIAENDIRGNQLFGVALFWLFVPPNQNQVRANALQDNGIDLWWDGWGVDNCFEGNAYRSSDPVALPSCAPLFPGAPISNVGIPDARKDAWLASVGLLQGGQPGTPWQTPLGPMAPPPV
jgi:parallel beta-helix repeat protein